MIGQMKDTESVTELQSDAGGVKTRFVPCEVTSDTRRKQQPWEDEHGETKRGLHLILSGSCR